MREESVTYLTLARGSGSDVWRLGERRPELTDRLRMDLAHPRLGDAEDLPDLRQREALEVVEGHDDLLALGQPVDRACQHPSRLLTLEAGGGVMGGIGQR